MKKERAIVYLRWACDPDSRRREVERGDLVARAEERGYEVEVLEEVGQPGDVYHSAREKLGVGQASALVVRDVTRLGRRAGAIAEAVCAMESEGWMLITRDGCNDLQLKVLAAMEDCRRQGHSGAVRRGMLARRERHQREERS